MYLHRKDRNDTTTDPDFDFEDWKAKHTAFADEATPGWVKAVKSRFGNANSKFACVGYEFALDCARGRLTPAGTASVPRMCAMNWQQIPSVLARLLIRRS